MQARSGVLLNDEARMTRETNAAPLGSLVFEKSRFAR